MSMNIKGLKIGTWIRHEGTVWIVHTIAWNVRDTSRIVGVVRIDNRCGSMPDSRWITVDEANDGIQEIVCL